MGRKNGKEKEILKSINRLRAKFETDEQPNIRGVARRPGV